MGTEWKGCLPNIDPKETYGILWTGVRERIHFDQSGRNGLKKGESTEGRKKESERERL